LSTSLRTSAATILIVLGLGSGVSLAQNLRNGGLPISADHIETTSTLPARQSSVGAKPASDAVEEAKVNEVYQAVVKIHLQGDLSSAAEMYRSLLIPMAESAPSNVTRKKFLFLSYRGLGNCYLGMSRFTEAEETFQKLFEYLPLRAGTEDSDYPINFESIAMAQMGEQRWKAAEESLQQALLLFDDQIGRTVAAASNSARDEHANRLRTSEDMALNLFAVVYYREQRYPQALEVLARAYHQAVAFGAPSGVVQQIVSDARAVSVATGDEDAIATWSKRVLELPISQ
jgi:tetratricopeptide (TPR) repeat protein